MAETEKITINLSVVDLGKIDLLADQGFYSNRTDFIRTAIRNQINTHDTAVEQAVIRQNFVAGVLFYNSKDLEKYQAAGEQLDIRMVGLFHLSNDVTPELALATIHSIKVHGVLRLSPSVKAALGDRIL